MTLVVILLSVGVVLLAVELLVPGAVLGIIGGIALLAGVITAFATLEQNQAFVALGVALSAGVGVLVLEFVVLPRTRLVRALSMTATVSGSTQAVADSAAAYIGHEAVAQTKLVPSGYVLVDGRQFEAFCRDGAAEPGTRLRVVGVDSFRLIVTSAHS